jgi:lysine 6-dehydrogenase
MRVLVLGIGKMGYGLLKDLTAQSRIEEVVAADINITQAKHFADRVGSKKIEVRRCDVNDRPETVRLMGEGFDAIASALPRPFCDSAVAAAIEARVGYADVAASFANIFDQDEAARKAGVTIIPHIGLDVGIDRVLCGVGARKLDKVDGFKVWCGGFPQKGTPGYYNPIRYKISWYWPYAALGNVGSSRVLKEGEMVDIPKLSDPEEIVFPEPIGKCETYTTGDLTDVIKHLGVEGVRDAWAKTVRWPGHCEIWQKLIDLKLLEEEPINVRGNEVSPRSFFLALGEKTLQYLPGEGDAVCQRVKVSGIRDDVPTSYVFEFVDFHDFDNDISAMARTTAFPCSIVAQMIANGEFTETGVVHPVKIGYDARLSEKFFAELKRRRINISEKVVRPLH